VEESTIYIFQSREGLPAVHEGLPCFGGFYCTLYTEVLHAVEESREKAFLAALLGGLLRCGGRQREKDPATLVKGPHIQVGDGEFFSLSVP
jgi:hypothetical protein